MNSNADASVREFRRTYASLKRFILSRPKAEGKRGVKEEKDSLDISLNNLENLWIEFEALPRGTKQEKQVRNSSRNKVSALESRIKKKLDYFAE